MVIISKQVKDDFKDKLVLEWSREWKVQRSCLNLEQVVAVDYSTAINANYQNLNHM